MRIQLNVSGRTVIELTPAMTEHFAAADAAARELAQKPTASVPPSKLLSVDEPCGFNSLYGAGTLARNLPGIQNAPGNFLSVQLLPRKPLAFA
jgi:hypothetical protein